MSDTKPRVYIDTDMVDQTDEYLIYKENRGYYKENAHGYTVYRAEAGRYTWEEAKRRASVDPDVFTIEHAPSGELIEVGGIIACLERESHRRRKDYPGLIEIGKLRAEIAAGEIGRMNPALDLAPRFAISRENQK